MGDFLYGEVGAIERNAVNGYYSHPNDIEL